MKKTILTLAVSLCAGIAVAQSAANEPAEITRAFEEAKKIERSIKQTSFPARVYNIVDFGAKPDAPDAPCHEAINNAILQCNQEGGGTVLIPKGTFYTGPITLKSNVNLHIEKDAVLKFDTDQSLYFPPVLTRWEGLDCYNARPLIYAYGETNIAITGKGIMDAQGDANHWWYMAAGRYKLDNGKRTQADGGRKRMLELGERGAPMHERIFTPEDAMRPQFVNLYRCTQVLIEDVTFLNSPFWTLHPLLCESLIVRGVTIENDGPNGDGCDPESCKNVLIENCLFNTGDDCIAIKSGRNADGRKWNIPSENIIVRGCTMKNGHGGVVIGSEISGGYKGLYVEDCYMDSPNLDRVIRIKTSTCRGGTIEDVFVRNVEVGQCREAVLRINLKYEQREECDRGYIPTVRNVWMNNVTSNGSKYGVLLIGLDESENIYDIHVSNCRFNGVTHAGENITGLTRNVNIDNCKVKMAPKKDKKKKK